jgi:glutathione synthase/RimK-type ligase-like ATP-grasp enzyme
VGVVTCAGEDVDPDSPALLGALGDAGLAAELVVWDDPAVDWDRYALAVVRSTWDYAARREQFLAWARAVPRLANRAEVLAYSTDKHYLRELAAAGVAVVETAFVDVGVSPAFPDGDVVVKPAVGAGSIGAERHRAHEHAAAAAHVAALHASGRDALVQPYVDSVDERGETALIFLDGQFSHAMTKGAMLNVRESDRHPLYRRERMAVATPEPAALVAARRALAAADQGELLYARVDVVLDRGRWAVLELELAEPSLFLGYAPAAARALAAAIARRVS